MRRGVVPLVVSALAAVALGQISQPDLNAVAATLVSRVRVR